MVPLNGKGVVQGPPRTLNNRTVSGPSLMSGPRHGGSEFGNSQYGFLLNSYKLIPDPFSIRAAPF